MEYHSEAPLLTWFNFNTALISSYLHYKVGVEITYTFPSFNGGAIEVLEWISNFIPHFIGMWLFIQVETKVKPC